MFVEAKAFEAGHVERAQVCVFGSGPAGLTVAHGLAEQGINVLLVEAGGLDFEDDSQEFYRGTVVGDRYFDLSEARLRMFGGTSNHWGGYCIPLSPQDFEPHPFLRDVGWPISAADLAPFLGEACNILDITNEFGEKYFAPKVIRTSFQYSAPVHLGEKYFDYCAESQNLRVCLDSALTGLRLDERAIHEAQVTTSEGRPWSVVADNYVICLGGIENSRMLLWMNEKSNGGLVPRSEILGRYWMEHPHAHVADVVFHQSGPDFFRDGKANFALTKDAQHEARVLNAGLLVEEQAYDATKELIADLMCVAPALGRELMAAFGKDLVCGARLRSHWEQAPVRENRVALGQEKDRFGIPRPVLHWHRSDLDRRVIVETVRIFGDELAREDLGRLRLADWIRDDLPIPDTRTMAGWHHMGGTRMSASANDGIVDRDLRLHGIENLYVGGSSVFPAAGYANPTLTIVQLSLRLAQHLARKY
jgi:choline dehydrogenase-like flavoprotein